jgi:ABC-type sugar transport system ATPase subunit
VQQVGTAAELYEAPANTFVASFIGSPPMNLIRGRLIKRGAGRSSFSVSQMTFDLPEFSEADGCQLKDSEVFLGIRPEDLCIAEGVHTAVMTGRVHSYEELGREKVLRFSLGHREYHAEHPEEFTARVPSRYSFAIGDEVPLALRADRLHFFAPDGRASLHVTTPVTRIST